VRGTTIRKTASASLEESAGRAQASGIDPATFFAVKPGTGLIREVVQGSEEGHLAVLNSLVEVPN